MIDAKTGEFEDRVFELEKSLEAKNQESLDLANIATVITSLLDIQSVLAVAMEIGIRQVSAEVGAVVLVEDGRPQVKVSWGVDATILEDLRYRDNLDLIRYCFTHQETICENDCADMFSEHGSIRNLICTPIMGKRGLHGAVVIFNKTDNRDFSDDDIRIVEMICKFTSISIENAILLTESLEKQRMEQELDLGREVQKTFLPETVAFPGLDITASYIPARQVGGDYYDIIPLSDHELFFLIGDVTNKGVPAALVMTSVYSIIRAFTTSSRRLDVKTIMEYLNAILCNDIIKSHDMFITLFMAICDTEQGYMEYCNGGHPPPFFRCKATGGMKPLKQGGPIVGQFADLSYATARVPISTGDRLFCYTDGLVEATNRDGELYGLRRLEEFFRNHCEGDTARFSDDIKAEIDRFSSGGSRESIDDYTTLVIDVVRPKTQSFSFFYDSTLDSLDRMHRDFDDLVSRFAVPAEVADPLRVAISEAATNAIIHAHGQDKTKKIRILVDLNEERISVSIRDHGTGIGHELVEESQAATSPDAEGGRGLGLIRHLSDEAHFESSPQGGLIVTIIKYVSRNEAYGGSHEH